MRSIIILLGCSLLASGAVRAEAPALGPILKAAERASQQGQFDQAAKLYLGVIERADQASEPDRQAVLQGLLATSRALVVGGQPELAVRALTALLRATRKPSTGPGFAVQVRMDLERLAFELVLTGTPDLAVEGLEALMADGPGSPVRWALLARAHLEQGEFTRANETLKRGLSQHPGAPELLFVRAALAGALSETQVAHANYPAAESSLQAAARDLERAAAKEQAAPGILRALGKVRGALWIYYRVTGSYETSVTMLSAAEQSYEQAAALDQNNPDIPLELADLMFSAQDWPWAEQAYRDAARRFQALMQRPDLSTTLRRKAQAQLDTCRRQITRSLVRRAVTAATGGHFARAREWNHQAAAGDPDYRPHAVQFDALLDQTERDRQTELDRLLGQPATARSLAALGDVWLRERRYEQAAEVYRRALAATAGGDERRDLESRLFGVQDLPDHAHKVQMGIGQLLVEAELPDGMDPSGLMADLEKAHALTMGLFPHRLIGPLELKVFANRRQFLDRAGMQVQPRQQGLYAFGRVITFDDPNRSRADWLDVLVHEISHRYVDEMTYHRAPRWLSEGLAQWASAGWDRQRQRRFEQLARSGGLIAWSELDTGFFERLSTPRALDNLYLQAHQMVGWLMSRFGDERVMTLLAGLRQGRDLDQSMRMAFGQRLEEIERHWAQEQR